MFFFLSYFILSWIKKITHRLIGTQHLLISPMMLRLRPELCLKFGATFNGFWHTKFIDPQPVSYPVNSKKKKEAEIRYRKLEIPLP